MLKRLAAVLLIVLSLSLQGCVSVAASLASYANNINGYQFLYPNGWVQVNVSDGPDVVFHDLIEMTENVSVVINPVPDGKTLQDLGSPSEVGYRLSKNAIAPPDSGRQAELISAESRDVDGITYYLLEYAVKLANSQERHNYASVAVRRGQLFTLNLSTSERRWAKKEPVFRSVVQSFSVY
ncbi:photosystem II reaction center PsbP family protein [Oscillatoria sp. FACHB-1407]|uniref:photosystem II reaction center PsbP n=1 Tax=Oscillatoria sp. FACHB-1407 TaxID=2692847 RepID=UPI001684FE9F|nr:photosystem II reaction center PsbP [Oscillatoria sp. FACHB-1407]MBD2461798.1 photosystem II reaction center PsbP family protein [Oscillatoria sp. FACHB-1407]